MAKFALFFLLFYLYSGNLVSAKKVKKKKNIDNIVAEEKKPRGREEGNVGHCECQLHWVS